MTRIHIDDVAYTAYQVPDLDLMERFLIDFGMMRAARTGDALFMRGTGANPGSPAVMVTVQGHEDGGMNGCDTALNTGSACCSAGISCDM